MERQKGATPAQIALAWLLAQKPWIVPIPGSRKLERLDENIGAVAVELTPDDLREIDAAIAKVPIQGIATASKTGRRLIAEPSAARFAMLEAVVGYEANEIGMGQFTRGLVRLHVALSRLTGGILGGNLIMARTLLLTTTGRKSGKPRTTPLRYLRRGDDFLIVASNWGEPNPPAWFYNLEATRHMTIQVMRRRMIVRAEIATGAENDALYAQFVAADQQFAAYLQNGGRTIPVVVLHVEDGG